MILEIHSKRFGKIEVGSHIDPDEVFPLGQVKRISLVNAHSPLLFYRVEFFDNTKTLEVIDVNYVIRDEE